MGTSIANGFYGCVDANNDGIADVLNHQMEDKTVQLEMLIQILMESSIR